MTSDEEIDYLTKQLGPDSPLVKLKALKLDERVKLFQVQLNGYRAISKIAGQQRLQRAVVILEQFQSLLKSADISNTPYRIFTEIDNKLKEIESQMADPTIHKSFEFFEEHVEFLFELFPQLNVTKLTAPRLIDSQKTLSEVKPALTNILENKENSETNENLKDVKGESDGAIRSWKEIFDDAKKDIYSAGWLPNILIGIVMLFFGPIVGGLMNNQRLQIYGAAFGFSLLIFILAWLVDKNIPETKPVTKANEQAIPAPAPLRGLLVPGNEPNPPNNPCEKYNPGEKTVFLGNSAVVIGSELNQFCLIRIKDKNLLTIENVPGGIVIDATIYDKDNNLVATIKKNVFNATNANDYYSKATENSLLVLDKDNNLIFSVRYLNPRAVKITGTFRMPGTNKSIDIDESRMMLGNSKHQTNCSEPLPLINGKGPAAIAIN